MSTAKRSRRRQPEARSPSPLPASKRVKITPTSHVPSKNGLEFLVDEDARKGRKLDARLTNGVPSGKVNMVDESHAVVASDTRIGDEAELGAEESPEVIDISSAVEDSSEAEESDEEVGAAVEDVAQKVLTNGHVGGTQDRSEEEDAQGGADDTRMQDIDMEEVEPEEPSFGDILQARHPQPIDVQATFADPMAERSTMMRAPKSQTLATPTAGSLTTVLTQALKTNDRDLLESCFQLTDLPSVRLTIQRLPPQLVSSLLQRLAERIYKRPGRTGNLMVWVQWSMVAHGGYLATQPDIMRRLRSLAQVAHERAQGLQPLLHLKGKLDMLSAQLDHRRSLQTTSQADDDVEDGVVYIEGQDEDWSSDEDDEIASEGGAAIRSIKAPSSTANGQTAASMPDISDSGDDDDSADEMPNGVSHASDDDSADDDVEEDGEGLLDIEAEETSEDGDEEVSSGDDDDDSAPESEDETNPSDDESEPEIRQPPPKTLSRKR